jgi:Phosphoglycerate kinase
MLRLKKCKTGHGGAGACPCLASSGFDGCLLPGMDCSVATTRPLGKHAEMSRLSSRQQALKPFKSSKLQVGSSLVEDDKVDLAKELMSSSGGKIILPTDVIIADKFAEDAKTDTVQSGDVPDGWMVRPRTPLRLTAAASRHLSRATACRWPCMSSSSSSGGQHSKAPVSACHGRRLGDTNCRAWTSAPTA